ncbi:MAG: hypothetical protein ABIM30_00125 [candidate division WOR-3 bacterium]
MKHDIQFNPETREIEKVSGKEQIINIFINNLFTMVGSDFFNPQRGTSILNAQTEGRIAMEIESAARQTINVISKGPNRFDGISLLKVDPISISKHGGKLFVELAFVFSDKTNITRFLEVRGV